MNEADRIAKQRRLDAEHAKQDATRVAEQRIAKERHEALIDISLIVPQVLAVLEGRGYPDSMLIEVKRGRKRTEERAAWPVASRRVNGSFDRYVTYYFYLLSTGEFYTDGASGPFQKAYWEGSQYKPQEILNGLQQLIERYS